MKYLMILSTILLFPFFLFGQEEENEPYKKEWKKADSLLNNGFPESAQKIAEDILSRASQKQQQVQMMKAQIYLMNAGFQRSEEAFQEAILKAEKEAASQNFPNNAIWHSIAAELYWNYYQNNRYQILDRTRVSTDTKIEDFEQWDASRFFEKTAAHYKASLQQAEALENVPIKNYNPILVKGVNTSKLRPSLFDLLAFRALAFFENDEKDLTKPAFAFVMNDAAAFASAEAFIAHKFKTDDTASMQWQALNIYKRLLEIHTDGKQPDAFIDADLHRLEFAYRASVLPNKKASYSAALEQIDKQWSDNPLSALAAFKKVQLMFPDDFKDDYGEDDWEDEDDEISNKKSEVNLPEIVAKLEAIIAKFPKSEGAYLAETMKRQLTTKSLSLLAEEAVLPNEASRILVRYQNIPKASLRLIRLENKNEKWLGNNYGYQEKLAEELLKLPFKKEWNTALPGTEDLEKHSAELMLEALPTGTYAVLISSKNDFSLSDNLMNYVVFQVTQISTVLQSGNGKGYALNRKTGKPIANAEITFYTERYNDNIRGTELRQISRTNSSINGVFSIPEKNESRAIRIVSGNDSFLAKGYFNGYRYRQETTPNTQTFFFTDRSIYRPGQTVFFKGVMVRREDGNRKNNTIANEKTEVVFNDVNGQKIASQNFTTNEFGSFSGSFIAPETGLTGNMTIRNSSGSASISVEEYKRPKFLVSFDTVKNAYAINETITVKGKAIAYAGNAIDGAVVKYRVVRETRLHYWWYAWRYGFPRSPEMAIENGTVTTDAQGNFSIDFKAIPDESVNPEALPVFTYVVSADVTDVNGETRSGIQTVSVGYTSLQLIAAIPEEAEPEELDTLKITSKNLNSQFVATEINLVIHRLKSPETFYRSRLWAVPDMFVMDEATFKKHFPNDPYKHEDDHLHWEKGVQVFQKNFTSSKEGIVAVPQKAWNENGWYEIEITATDKNGKKITEKKFVEVASTKNNGNISRALMLLPATQKQEPGATAKVNLLSAYTDLHLLRNVSDMTETDDVSQLEYSGKPIIWTRQINEADRGGIQVFYLTVKENRVYTESAFINVPWSNKDLYISWETHRDKLEPGAKETWTMVVSGNKKEKVAAELVATLYDASLDAFRPHNFNIYRLFPTVSQGYGWNYQYGFTIANGRQVSNFLSEKYPYYNKSYDQLIDFGFLRGRGTRYIIDGVQVFRSSSALDASKDELEVNLADASAPIAKFARPETSTVEEKAPPPPPPNEPQQEISVRKNLQETAFFFPQLKTDEAGNIRIEFTLPEALTEWKLLAFAHTKDMATGKLEGAVKTQKDLMVMPNLPRFFRQGDEITIAAKISNLSENALTGTAQIQLLNALTLQPVNLPFRLSKTEQPFSVLKDGSTSVSWKLNVPESMYEPVTVRISARAGNFTDGEENTLPVITNRMLVTETLPLWINGNGTKNFSFSKLQHADSSKTLVHHALTLEYTGNPAWYAVQALPYMMEYPYECAEQTFNRYYATALAGHIVAQSPKIKTIFERWKNEKDFETLSSPLEKNQELKSALLEETPWVMEAKGETEQRKRIGQLFDAYKLSKNLNAHLRSLEAKQLSDGSFPWFHGMGSDRFITQYIITGLGKLEALGVKDAKSRAANIIAKALPYLDREMRNSYEELLKYKANMNDQQIGYAEVQYLYMRSFMEQPVASSAQTAYKYYQGQAKKYWSQFNPFLKGMIALALHRSNDATTPKTIIASLRETAIEKEEMGMYWMAHGNGYWWYQAPIEAQSLLIEAFNEIAKDETTVDKMKIWLLKNKQTQNWESTKATADACYALLLAGSDWLTNTPNVSIQLGDKTISSDHQKTEAGSGYFKKRFEGKEVTENMGNIQLTVQDNPSATSWGAVYWQYFEDLDKITSAKTPLEIRKQLFIEKNTPRGHELQEIKDGNNIKIGDKIKMRIEILVDRDMEYVHLKDMRAAGFEPVNVLSGYHWQGGLGYYESTKDVSTNFFFDRLRKGKYVFEYPVFAQQAGDFSNGIATIQCMYAPEFSSHSNGIRVQVSEK